MVLPCKKKGKGMVLYSAVSSPLDRSKRFTLSSPGRPVHSDTVLGFSWKHSSHASIAQRLSTHISTTVYSQILNYTAESTEASWSERKCPNFETVTTGIRTRTLSIASPAFYQLSYRAPLYAKPTMNIEKVHTEADGQYWWLRSMPGDSRPPQQSPVLCTAKWQEEPVEEPEGWTAARKCLRPITALHLYQPSTSAYGLQQVADDLWITTQQSDFQHVEQTLELALDEMSIYYSRNHLTPNPTKTHICCFHLRNRDAKRKLIKKCNGLELDHYPNPIYLGVTLDRTLSFRQHALNTKAKVNTRNNLLRTLTNSRCGSHPSTMRTTALAAVTRVIRQRKRNYYDEKINETQSNPKQLWKVLNQLTGKQQRDEIPGDLNAN